MLTLWSDRAECLWDESLPVEVKDLPADLAAVDVVLADPELMMVILERFRREVVEQRRAVLTDGRPTIAMETYIRLMVLKQRYRWGYKTLVAEVSDSLSSAAVLSDLAERAGAGRVDGPQADAAVGRGDGVGDDAVADRHGDTGEALPAAGGADRLDGDRGGHQHPTDSGLASHGVRALGREGRKLAKLVGERRFRVRDRSRQVGQKLRSIARTIRRRTGEAKSEVLTLTKETGELLERSIREARRLAAAARRAARGRGARAKLTAAGRLQELADRCEKVARQIRQRIAGEKITDRIVSLADPDARPIRKGKIGKPNLCR
jgi:IS5 family transposase